MIDLYHLEVLREEQTSNKDAWEPVPLYLELEKPINQEQKEDDRNNNPGFIEIYL